MENNIKVHLISLDKNVSNPLIIKVVDTINSYLLRNKGAGSDIASGGLRENRRNFLIHILGDIRGADE